MAPSIEGGGKSCFYYGACPLSCGQGGFFLLGTCAKNSVVGFRGPMVAH